MNKVESRYKDSLYYDDVVTIVSRITELPTFKIIFHYDVISNDKIVNQGITELIFYDTNNKRVCRAPKEMTDKLKQFFTDI